MHIPNLNTPTPPHILAEQLRVSHRQLPAAISVGLVLALGVGWIFYQVIPNYLLLTWLISIIVFSLLRVFSLQYIGSESFSEDEARHYALRYTITAFLLGCTWASLAFLLPYINTEERILIFVVLISIAGGAITTTTGYILSYYSYTYPILISYAAQAFLLEGHIWTLLAIMIMLYGIYMTIAAWKLYVSMQENITLRYSWQEIADTLEITRQELNTELDNRAIAEEKLKTVMTELEQLAAIDELTGIPNRRSFDAAIAREWSRARREKTSLALLMIDIDFFKYYNDMYHHQQGDVTLKRVAQTLKKFAQRPGDSVARYGGEEFALILVDPAADYVTATAEKLRQSIRELQIRHEGSKVSDFLTISIGTAMMSAPDNEDYSALISAADQALYEAKHAGRNRVKAA